MAQRGESKLLTNNVAVLDALGGDSRVEALTGAGYKTVKGWRAGERFGARYFLVMIFGLWSRGFTADPGLWGQVTPRNRKAALSAMIAAQRASAA